MSIPNGRRAGLWTLAGFNGELHEPGTHWQILGNGRRVYNPVLCRFHSPDPLSPFGRGGINAYAYCGCDPVNYTDPDGTFALPLMMLGLVAGAGGAAAAAFASPSDNDGGGGSATPWIVGGVIAAMALMAGAGMAGRRLAPMKLGNSSAPGPGSSWAKRAGSTSSGTPTAASPVALPPPSTPARAAAPSAGGSSGIAYRDKATMTSVDMADLPSPVRDRILEIRQYGARGRTPDPTKVRSAKPFDNINGALPDAQSQTYYHRLPVYWGQGSHKYGAWRIVTGSSSKGGYHEFYVTPTHYANFFRVRGWHGYR
ncbi:RHS repeat-associated core domain-containing protein [Stenotrophomonas sp. PD6]|uniref:RHS repeat-associated core domain-containing protein n=1 Tax=Stenotrophomonas sp. PD6 TaxID=3368612 RepID=UPI003BA148FC